MLNFSSCKYLRCITKISVGLFLSYFIGTLLYMVFDIIGAFERSPNKDWRFGDPYPTDSFDYYIEYNKVCITFIIHIKYSVFYNLFGHIFARCYCCANIMSL